MVKCEQQKDSPEIRQTKIYPPSNQIQIPDLTQFCFPNDLLFKPDTNFVFYLKGGDDSDSTYGYVYYIDEPTKKVANCIVSQYYDPTKIFDLLYQTQNKSNFEISRQLSQSAQTQVSANYLANEQCAIQNDLFEFCCAFDLYDLGKLIVHMLLDCKIIISGNDIGRVSRSLFGLLSAIYPLPWPGVFIPMLPQKMIDAVYAPFPYLIGIHDSMSSETENSEVESHIFVDLVKKAIVFGLEEITLPSKIDKALNSFKKQIIASSLDKQVFQNSLRELILQTVAIALNQLIDNPQQILSTWEEMKNLLDLESFSAMICQSQLVLQLMRIIEQGPESESYKCFFDSALASKPGSKRLSGHFHPFVKRKRRDSENIKLEQRPFSVSVFDRQALANIVQAKNEKSAPLQGLTPPSAFQTETKSVAQLTPPLAVQTTIPQTPPKFEQKEPSSENSYQKISDMAAQFSQRRSAIDEMIQQRKEESQRSRESQVQKPVTFAQKIAMFNSPAKTDEQPPLKSVQSLPPGLINQPKRAQTLISYNRK